MTRESWKPIPGWRWYEASDQGRVRSLTHTVQFVDGRKRLYEGRVLRQSVKPSGHLFVNIGKTDSSSGVVDVHILVMLAFCSPKPEGQEVRHLNGDEKDNRLSNLRWGTRKRNSQDKKWHRGQPNYTLTPAQVLEIKQALRNPYWGQLTELGKRYGVTKHTIFDIKRGKSHQDILL